MKYATTADLRNNLSAYLREVEAGERIVVLRRDRPVAELGPARPVAADAGYDAKLDARLASLEREGLVRVGTGVWPDWLRIPMTGEPAGVAAALLDERNESP